MAEVGVFTDDMNTSIPKEIFDSLFESYKANSMNPTPYHRINQDLNSEVETRDSYKGREILEMLQNAEDQNSSYFFTSIDTSTQTICFYNGGIPFSKKGFDAILFAKTSPKKGNLSSIGNKGLGFRSILNWAESVDIYSRHTHVSFSVEIAKQKWEQLRATFRENGYGINIVEIQNNVNKLRETGKEIKVPLSVFAVPKVTSYEELPAEFLECDEEISTLIKVKYKSELQKNILDQIKAIKKETLLFITNIKRIVIKVDGKSTIIRKDFSEIQKKDNGNIFECEVAEGDGSSKYYMYIEDGIYKEYEKELEEYTEEDNYQYPKIVKRKFIQKYQLGLVVNVESQESKCLPLYSFFETQVETNLPCILHGSFSLSPDRKYLEDNNEYNLWLQRKLGERLCSFAEYLASNQVQLGIDKWTPFDILNFKALPSDSLSELKKYIDDNWSLIEVLPTLNNVYKKKANVCWYSEEIANLISSDEEYVNSGFGNHLIPDFSKHIGNIQEDLNFADKVDSISKKINEKYDSTDENFDHRIALLDALKNANYKCPDKFKISIVVDENKVLLTPNKDSKIYVNTGVQIDNPPAVLKFRYVSKKLVELLKVRWGLDDRDVASALQNFIDITPADIALIKKKVSDILYEEPEISDYKEIIKSLYNTSGVHFLTRSTMDGISFEPYDNQTDALHLMAQDGNFYPASEMVLDSNEDSLVPLNLLNERWKIKWTVAEWMDILGEDEPKKIKAFFTNVLGVSECVPKMPVGVVKDDNIIINAFEAYEGLQENSYHYYNSKIKDYRQWNVAYIPNENFLRELQSDAHLSLIEVFSLIMSDSLVRKSLLNNKLYYSLHTIISSTTVEYSYTALRLRPLFETYFKTIIVSEFGETVSSIVDKSGSAKSDVENAFVALGAFRTEEDLSMKILYQRMADVAKKFHTDKKSPVQTEYKKIRELIKKRKERHPEEIDEIATYLLNPQLTFVVKCENKLKIAPASEVYYWDNDKFPKKILDKYPKLMIGSRVGEDSVQDIFGVKLMKNVDFTITASSKENVSLTNSLISNLKERYQYLLAVRCADADSLANIKLFGDALTGMEITAYTECEYSESTNTVKNKMDLGDLLVDNNSKCHIRSNALDYESAVKDPKFCESLVEFLCIKLKAAESNWFDAVRTVVKNSKKENEYYLKREHSEQSYWTQINKALGLSNEESEFWDEISAQLGKPRLDKNILVDRKLRLSYIQDIYEVTLTSRFPDRLPLITALSGENQLWLLKTLGINKMSVLGGMNKIENLYNEWLDALQNKYSKEYFSFLREKIAVNIDENKDDVESFLTMVEKFKSGEVFEQIPSECWENLYDFEGFEKLVKIKIQEKLSIQCADLDVYKDASPDILPQYDVILGEYNRSKDSVESEIMTYAYFEGFEEIFREKLKEKNCQGVENAESKLGEPAIDNVPTNPRHGKLMFLDATKWTSEAVNNTEHIARGRRKKQGPFADSRSLAQKGRKAEQIVRDLFRESSDYKIVNEWSTNLNPSGDNSKHRDLDYQVAGSNETRYLEIKASSDGHFMMSSGEYDFAKDKDNVDKFDIALVDEDENVTILKSPFVDSRIVLKPDTYVGKINIITE